MSVAQISRVNTTFRTPKCIIGEKKASVYFDTNAKKGLTSVSTSLQKRLTTQAASFEVSANTTEEVDYFTPGVKIQKLNSNVWIFTESLGPAALGLDPFLRMTAVVLPDGDVWLHSPISLSSEVSNKLKELGPVKHIVISNLSLEHGLFARSYATAYPEAQIYAPTTLNKLSIGVRWGLPRIDHVLTNDSPPAWGDVIDQVILNPGVPLFPIEALFCYKPSGILLASDSLIYGNEKSYRYPINRALAKLVNLYEKVGGLLPFLSGLKLYSSSIENVLSALREWDYDTLILGHLSSPVANGKKLVLESLGVNTK